MLKIGLFSKLSRVSIRMLRYYDEIGLLHPAYIDPESDYRYYREDQLPQIGWITALRDMGFSLADVCRMTEIGHDAEKLAPYFEARRRELEADAAKTARQLLLLESARNRLGKEDIMQYNVTIKTIPERYAACVHTIIPRYSEEGSVWKTLCEETDGMRLVPDEPCYCAVTFLDGEYKERDVEIEAWKTVKGSYPDTAHVKFRTLPAVTVASCTFRGPYERIGEVYAAIAAWIADNGYECDGPMFNIYHVSPHRTLKNSSPKPATRCANNKAFARSAEKAPRIMACMIRGAAFQRMRTRLLPAVLLGAAVDGEDGAQGDQRVLRVEYLQCVTVAEGQEGAGNGRDAAAVLRDLVVQTHKVALNLPAQLVQRIAAGKERKIPRQVVFPPADGQRIGTRQRKRHVLHGGGLPPGGVLHDQLFAEIEKLAVRAVDKVLVFVPDIKVVKRQKFLF